MSNHTSLAEQVAEMVGGPQNVKSVNNCTTRLRFVVRDRTQVRSDDLKQVPGVIQVVDSGGQVQVVVGTHVEQVKNALVALPGWSGLKDGGDAGAGQMKPMDRVFDFLSGTFQPLLLPLVGAAMVKVVVILLEQFHVLPTGSPTLAVLAAAGNALFYFLPIFVGFTASRKLGANGYLGAVICAALLEPNFTALGAAGDVSHFAGLPLYLFGYASTMFPALLVALALAGLERVLRRIIPQTLQLLVIPTAALGLLVPLTALVFGPIGVLVGNSVASGVTWLSTAAPLLFYVVVAASWVALVSLGLHWAVLPVVLTEFATLGESALFAAASGYQWAMIGAALGVTIKARHDKSLRAAASAATIAGAVAGVTEPTLYGIVLRYKRVLLAEVVGAAAGGLVLGLFKVTASGLALAPILSAPLLKPMGGYLLAGVVALSVTAAIILWRGYEAPSGADTDAGEGSRDAESSAVETEVLAPLAGEVLALGDVPDPIFSAGLLGQGIAIRPTSDRVVAPADGTVVVVPDSGHAVGLRTDGGLELLVHVGIDTVKLAGRGFTPRVAVGDRVRQGQVLLTFDRAVIEQAGYSLVTPVLVTKGAQPGAVVGTALETVAEGDTLLTLDTVAAVAV